MEVENEEDQSPWWGTAQAILDTVTHSPSNIYSNYSSFNLHYLCDHDILVHH